MSKKVTTESFIQEASILHNNKYDYSKTIYKKAKTKVIIICPVHGEFLQTPCHHLIKKGCKKCANEKLSNLQRGNKEEFVEKARKIHNNKYNYSLSVYIDCKTNLEIICPVHGSFWQQPNNHLSGKGCLKCYREKPSKRKNSFEVFLKKCQESHGNKYDYSNANYISCNDNIEIICPRHGSFFQTPSNHYSGEGCLKCGKEVGANKKRIGKERFIERSNKKHNNKYNYSKVEYVNSSTKIEIICPVHGLFKQKPSEHYNHGCPKCTGRYKTTEEFINDAIKKHGLKFDYSKVNYINSSKKITIICPKHGPFEQIPSSHLQGAGCAKCHIQNVSSKNEILIKEKITETFPNLQVFYNYRELKQLQKLEVDIFIPDIFLAIEINGIYWHSKKETKRKDLFKKTVLGENLIQIIDYSKKNENFAEKTFNEIIKPEIEKRLKEIF
jgi:hypothetical protein